MTSGITYMRLQMQTKQNMIGTTAYSCTKTIDSKDYIFDAEGVWVENQNILSDKGADFIGSWEGFLE